MAIDSTILRARGGVWNEKHREKGELPHSSIEPETRLPQIELAWLDTARRLRRRSNLVSSRRCAHEMRNEGVEELTVDQRAKTEQIEALPS